MRRFIPLFIAFFIIYGCLSSIGGQQYTQNYYSNIDRIAIHDPSQVAQCKQGSCHCFVCEDGRPIPGIDFMQNLAGGRCFWETDCNQERAAELMSDSTPKQTIRGFMIGMGPSISDWADASPYCNNGLRMAVQWLIGDEDNPYDLPDASRSICLLTLDTIPVYVLYSNGTDISDTQAGEVARILKEQGDEATFNSLITIGEAVGPTIIVTEIDFDVADAGLVADQVEAINNACNPNRDNGEVNCFVAVAPKFNDNAAMDAIMQMPGMNEQVDFIAYGINYRYADKCEWGPIMEQAINFSKRALYNYSKPTIIPYILFDSTGTDKDGSCTWDEDKMLRAYGQIFPHSIEPLQQRGVIGIAPYSFQSAQYGVTNPLNCSDCDLGKNSQRRESSFFAGCHALTTVSRKDTTHRGGGVPMIFPNESAGFCDFNMQLDRLFREVTYADSVGGRDFFSPQQTLKEPAPTLYRCSACVSQNLSATTPPFDFTTFGGTPDDKYCNATEETKAWADQIESWADRRNLDPMLVRAFIYAESKFEPCSAVKVCSADYQGAGCFARGESGASECYKGGYDAMYDPRDSDDPQYCEIENDEGTDPPRWRRCAFGLMQTVVPPSTFWPSPPASEEGEHYDIFQTTKFNSPAFVSGDLVIAKSCAPDGNFNPFNTSHNLCMGTARMASAMKTAKSWIESNKGLLNWDITKDYEKTNAFTAYVAAHDYGGIWNSKARRATSKCSVLETNGNCWGNNFFDSWEVTEKWCSDHEDEEGNYPKDAYGNAKCTGSGEPNKAACYGYTDFVEYVDECEKEHMDRPSHGASTKMGVYYWLKSKCKGSFCPPHNRLLTEADRTSMIPSSGNLYVLDPPPADSGTSGTSGGSSTGGSSSGGGSP
jgi:hypothetical protein